MLKKAGWGIVVRVVACAGLGAGCAAGATGGPGGDTGGSGGGTEATTSTGVSLCGNGVIDAGEQCDGAALNGSNCMAFAFDAGQLACGADCQYDNDACILFTCGNGVLDDVKEDCDGEELAGEDCKTLGFGGGTLDCTQSCHFEVAGCIDEDCYDAVDNDMDGQTDCDDPDCAQICSYGCVMPPTLPDPANVTSDTTGHGQLFAEECTGAASGPEIVYQFKATETGMLDVTLTSTVDLGVSIMTSCGAGTLTCTDDMTGGTPENVTMPIKAGDTVFIMVDGKNPSDAGPFTLTVASRPVTCGDTLLEGAEQCDDGNTTDGDGCSSTCKFECSMIDCDDGNACTNDLCMGGACSHPYLDPNDNDVCTIDSCDTITGVSNTPVAIDDGDICTADLCDPMSGAVTHVPANIDDANACTTDTCNSISGTITHTPLVCNDGNGCTADTCNPMSGACIYTPVSTTTYFTESFANNAAGWQLGAEWAIGATSAVCSDPATDTTPTADNGVAGVVLGGCASTTLHAFNYLTSPIVNTSAAPQVFLHFQRWLHTDYTPYMNSDIEVYNGTSWVQIWQNGASGVSDSAWVPQTFDISAYKNANMRVRFGVTVGSSGVFSVGQWNIDDLYISNSAATCP